MDASSISCPNLSAATRVFCKVSASENGLLHWLKNYQRVWWEGSTFPTSPCSPFRQQSLRRLWMGIATLELCLLAGRWKNKKKSENYVSVGIIPPIPGLWKYLNPPTRSIKHEPSKIVTLRVDHHEDRPHSIFNHQALPAHLHQFQLPSTCQLWMDLVATLWRPDRVLSGANVGRSSQGLSFKIQILFSKTLQPQQIWIYGYGSIPINTIFRGMNIHLPAILMWTTGVQGFDTLPY